MIQVCRLQFRNFSYEWIHKAFSTDNKTREKKNESHLLWLLRPLGHGTKVCVFRQSFSVLLRCIVFSIWLRRLEHRPCQLMFAMPFYEESNK